MSTRFNPHPILVVEARRAWHADDKNPSKWLAWESRQDKATDAYIAKEGKS